MFFGCKMNLYIDYGMKLNYKLRQPRSSRGVSGDDPEGGARHRLSNARKLLALLANRRKIPFPLMLGQSPTVY